MTQITLRISREDFELLVNAAVREALRPLTLASSLLATAIRGQIRAKKEWEDFKSVANPYALIPLTKEEEAELNLILKAKGYRDLSEFVSERIHEQYERLLKAGIFEEDYGLPSPEGSE